MATQTAGVLPEGKSRAPARSGYFFWTAVLLLALVLIGFTPTLYARPLFTQFEPNMPWHLYLHGAVLTGWFAWFAFQTWLVRSRNTALHRKTGWVGVALAAGVCVAGPMATLNAVPRLIANGMTFDTDMSALPFVGVEGVTVLEFASPVVWGNLMGIAMFAILVGAAVWLRKRPDYHKRLMMLASISIVPPALARISRWPVFGGEDSVFFPIAGLGLLFSVLAYDLIVQRRPHRATVIATLAILAMLVSSNLIAASEFGRAFVRSLA